MRKRSAGRNGARLIAVIVTAISLMTSVGPSSAETVDVGDTNTREVCPPQPPGYARCLSIIRTDVHTPRGPLPSGVTPPGLIPADLRSAYNLPSMSAGEGVTIAIVVAYHAPKAEQDLAVYREQFGLPPCTTANGCFRQVDEIGGTTYPLPDTGWALEAALDLDMASAVCPRCDLVLIETDTNFNTDLMNGVYHADEVGADVVSMSWGSLETAAHTDLEPVFTEQPQLPFVAAAGDTGYEIVWPGSSRNTIAAGGTLLVPDAGDPRGWAESAWSNSGGGCSLYHAKQPWQTDPWCPNRTVADVSAVGDPASGVAVYDSDVLGGWGTVGGTSASAPIIAGVYALAGGSSSGPLPGSFPYENPSDLFDIVSGSTASCLPTYMCNGEPGHDGPTGHGTPNGFWAFMEDPPVHQSGDAYAARKGCAVKQAENDRVRVSCRPDRTGSVTWAFDAAPVNGVGIYREKYSSSACKASVAQATSGGDLLVTLKMKKLTKKNTCEVMATWVDPA